MLLKTRRLLLATALWLAILAYLTMPVQMPTRSWSSDAKAATITQRDAAVIQAALDGFLRLEARRELGKADTGGVQALEVLNQTLRFCDLAGDANPLGCLHKWNAQKVPTVASNIATWGQRGMLREFWERNQQSQFLSNALTAVKLLPPPAVSAALRTATSAQLQSRMERVALIGVSTPAYSGDGHALVFAKLACGALCGYDWFILLREDGLTWRVVATDRVAIS